MGPQKRQIGFCQLAVVAHVHVLGVEPAGLVGIEAGSGFADPLQREVGDQLVHREELLLGAGIPSQQREHVDERFGEVAVLAVSARHLSRGRFPFEREDGESHLVAVSFAELALSGRLQQQGQMGEFGLRVRPSECSVEQVMERERRQPLLAADHVRDLHQVVVHDIGQVIGGKPVRRLIKHLVVERGGVHRHIAANEVVHADLLVFRHHEADHPLVAPLDAGTHLFRRQRQRSGKLPAHLIVISERFASLLRLRAQPVQCVGGVERIVGMARFDQLQGILQVDFPAFALPVGAVRAAFAHPFVGPDAAPLQRIENILLRAGYVPVRIGVFDADDKVAARPACEKIVVERRPDAAHVQGARRTRRETNPYPSLCHLCVAVHVFASLRTHLHRKLRRPLAGGVI